MNSVCARTAPRIMGIAWAVALVFAGGVRAEDVAPVAKPKPAEASSAAVPKDAVPVEALLGEAVPDEEKPLYNTIFDAAKNGGGARDFLKGRKLFDLTARGAVMEAFELNLGLQIQAHRTEYSRAALNEARSVFYPVFEVSALWNHSEVNERIRWGLVTKYFGVSLEQMPGTQYLSLIENSNLQEVWWYKAMIKETVPGPIFASKVPVNNPDNRFSGTIAIDQQLPWGPALRIAMMPAFHHTDYDNLNHSYGRPYETAASVSFYVPLPFTKNFGPYSAYDAAIKEAKLARDLQLWQLKALMNTTLAETDRRYWNLVLALKSLEATIENRKSIEALAKSTGELLEKQRTTAYGKDQADAQLLLVRNAEEQAWNSYAAVSNDLVSFLNLPPGQLLIPVGYSRLMQQQEKLNPEEAVKIALEKRAELRAANLNADISRVQLRAAETQERPSLSVTGSVNGSQTASSVGYKSFTESVASTFDPDSRNQNYTLTFQRPLFNRAENALTSQARSMLGVAKIDCRLTENQVAQEANNAASNWDTTQGVYAAEAARLEAAREAYKSAQEMFQAGRMTEFEIVSRSQEWLSASLDYVRAIVRTKQAESQLLGAEGTLLERYAEMTAHSDFERYRLGLLKASHGFNYFYAQDDVERKQP